MGWSSNLIKKLIFRFLCSSDCVNGKLFVNKQMTDIVFKFVKLISEKECLIEFSDHSLGSFFSNWNNEQMGIPNPIEILKFIHSGEFKMCGKKSDFENSSHPTLKQIGDMSTEPDIEITFNNMVGTKVYKILNSDIVKSISTGNQLNYHKHKHHNDIFTFSNTDGNRGESVRIGKETMEKGYGYFEDRRPAANCDPYKVISYIFHSAILSSKNDHDSVEK